MDMKHAAVVAGLALGLMSETANASFVYKFTQSASGVSVNGSGSINLAGETSQGSVSAGFVDIYPSQPEIYTGFIDPAQNGKPVQVYSADFTSIPPYGTGGDTAATSGTGALFGFGPLGTRTPFSLFVPTGYTSGEVISSSAFFSGATFTSLGLTQGTQTYVLGNNDFIQINVPGAVGTVPLPASAPLFGASLIALGAAGYAAKRRKAMAA